MLHSRVFSLALFVTTTLSLLNAQDPNGWRKFGDQAPSSTPTIPAGTYITVRTDNYLTSDHNLPGDSFVTTLVEPIVVDGLVVARRGQVIRGRVTEVVKAGDERVSHLGLELIELTLSGYPQVQLHTQLTERTGHTAADANIVLPESVLIFRLEAPARIPALRVNELSHMVSRPAPAFAHNY